MKDAPFKVDIEKLRHTKIDLEIEAPPEDLDLALEDWKFDGLITGGLRYSMVDNDVRIEGSLDARAVGQCIRCLGPAPCRVHVAVDLTFLPGRPDSAEDLAAPDQPVLLDFYAGDAVNPVEQLRDLVILELPDLPLCREDCKGLCPTCGGNRNEVDCDCARKAEAFLEADSQSGEKSDEDWKDKLRRLKME